MRAVELRLCLSLQDSVKPPVKISAMDNELDPSEKQKQRGRPFERGNPGRPRGSRNKMTVALEQLLEGQAEAVVTKVVEKALEGDRMAMRLVFERVVGSRPDRPLPDLHLPPMHSVADGAVVSAAILAAVSSGQITPMEGEALMRMVHTAVGAFEARDSDQRRSAFEASEKENGRWGLARF
jgi:tellurite resistance protein